MRRLCQTLPNHAVALRGCRKARDDLVVAISIQVDGQLNAVCSARILLSIASLTQKPVAPSTAPHMSAD
jgi:hypothetical protein